MNYQYKAVNSGLCTIILRREWNATVNSRPVTLFVKDGRGTGSNWLFLEDFKDWCFTNATSDALEGFPFPPP